MLTLWITVAISCMICFADGVKNLSLDVVQKIISSVPMYQNQSPQRLLPQTSDLLSKEVAKIRRLESIIYSITSIEDSDTDWDTIDHLTMELQLSELYISKRQKYIDYLRDLKCSSLIIPVIHRHFFQWFHIQGISLSQYQQLSFDNLPITYNLSSDAKQKLKILLGSSRAFHHPFSAEIPHPRDFAEETRYNLYDDYYLTVPKNFPWYFLDNIVYLGYLCEFMWNNYHKEMYLPNYDSIWYLNKDPAQYEKLEFVKYLINHYHLTLYYPTAKNALWSLWEKRSKQEKDVDSRNPSSIFLWQLVEAERLNKIFLKNMTFKSTFMTHFVIDLARYLNINENSPQPDAEMKPSREYCRRMLHKIMRFCMAIGDDRSASALVDILASPVFINNINQITMPAFIAEIIIGSGILWIPVLFYVIGAYIGLW